MIEIFKYVLKFICVVTLFVLAILASMFFADKGYPMLVLVSCFASALLYFYLSGLLVNGIH